MNFFTALSIFNFVSPTVDISSLPIVATTYVLVENQVASPRLQNRWQIRSPNLLENLLIKPNFITNKFDTAYAYIQLDSAHHPIKYTATMDENPIQNGTEFLYEGDLIKQRIQYTNGVPTFTTNYFYENNNLTKVITSDSAGTIDTTKYSYMGEKITQIESIFPTGSAKTKCEYFGTDTIRTQGYDSKDSALAISIVWKLSNGLIQKENRYENGKLFEFRNYVYGNSTSHIRKRHIPKLCCSNDGKLPSNLLGRRFKQVLHGQNH